MGETWKPPVIAVLGATAVGKTEVGIALSKLLPVSIISLDSAMVYRGMDIGTAKPSAELRRRFPHALVDVRDPTETYSAAEFLRDADAAVQEALAMRQIPLLVGGTMLYLRTFREGLGAMPGADPAVRSRLAAEAETLGWEALHARLVAADPLAGRKIHPNNGSRIQRALEVLELTGRPISSFWARSNGVRERLGLELHEFAIQPSDRGDLHRRIATRLDRMFEAGFLEEVAALRSRADLNSDLPAMRAVGYRQVWEHLDGRLEGAEMRKRALVATRQLAKRQLTWLRGWPEVRNLPWGDPERLARDIAKRAELAFS